MLALAVQVSNFFFLLTSKEREKVLIFDDSTYDRSRSKVVELLAWIFDRNSRRSLKGFKLLTLGWSDGASFLPLDFVLCSSAKPEKRVQGITKDLDKRTCGYKRRLEAITKSTEHLESMVKRALAVGIKADYILMDRWFCWPAILAKLSQHLPVICMAKNMPKVFYRHHDQWVTLGTLYSRIKKRPGKAHILSILGLAAKSCLRTNHGSVALFPLKRYIVNVICICNWTDFYLAVTFFGVSGHCFEQIPGQMDGPRINIDETTVQVLREPGRDPTTRPVCVR